MFKAFLPPGANLEALDEVANAYFHDHEASLNKWITIYKVGGILGSLLLGAAGAGITAGAKQCPEKTCTIS